MDALQKARETQLRNIEAKAGKNLEAIKALIQASGLTKHGEIRDFLKKELGLGHGDANALVHYALATDGQTAAESQGLTHEDVFNDLYSGKKAGLRPLHDTIMATIHELGDFEIAPKKGYVSLRRKKQFAMVGPATSDAIEIGLNIKTALTSTRLKVMPPNSMCNYTLRIKNATEFDTELKEWLKSAFESAA